MGSMIPAQGCAPMQLEDKVRFLSDPKSYPRPTSSVAVRETHTSFVFLTDDRAYKLKKPVQFPYLDFTHLEARKHCCREEVRLNRELAGPVYLGTVSLTADSDGNLSMGGKGRIVDWLVEMERLPEEMLLGNRIESGGVTRRQLQDVVAVLHRFYAHQRHKKIDAAPYLEHLTRETAINAAHLREMRQHLGSAYSEDLVVTAGRLIERHRGEIRQRIKAGLVIEGHGDLRPEHVCLTPEPVIFDRLEFDPAMLFVDIYDEVNYLGLECTMLDAEWIRSCLLESLEALAGHPPTGELLAAYGIFRCLLRARLAIDHLRDPHPRTPDKWPRLAKAYLRLARQILEEQRGG